MNWSSESIASHAIQSRRLRKTGARYFENIAPQSSEPCMPYALTRSNTMVDEKALEAARVAAAAQWNKQNCQSEHAIADATLRGERDDTIEVQAALSAYLQALSPGSTGETEGWVLVPREITPKMAHALESNIAECVPPSEVHAANWRDAYRALLSAAGGR